MAVIGAGSVGLDAAGSLASRRKGCEFGFASTASGGKKLLDRTVSTCVNSADGHGRTPCQWQESPSRGKQTLPNIARHAWSGQDAGEIAYTTNGGRQWIRASVQGFDVFGQIMAVAFADSSTGWAGGNDAFFGGSRGVLSRSSDGGKTWEEQLEFSDFTFNGLETIDSLIAFAVGGFDFTGGGLVLRTTNGGIFWEDVTPASEGFRDVFFIDASTGWIVGSSIYKTTDGGSSWTEQYGDSSSELDAISFFDPLTGWATGFNNLVLHTTDGGQTWVPQNVGAPPVTAITGVTAVNSTTAWVAGWNGFVAQTRNGGQTWRKETVAGAEGIDFEDALFLDAQSGWVGGNIGIWKRSR